MNKRKKILTEEELLNDDTEHYMSEAQLFFFKNKLEILAKELLDNAGETTEHLRKTSLVPDPADRATLEEEYSLELRTRDRERKLFIISLFADDLFALLLIGKKKFKQRF